LLGWRARVLAVGIAAAAAAPIACRRPAGGSGDAAPAPEPSIVSVPVVPLGDAAAPATPPPSPVTVLAPAVMPTPPPPSSNTYPVLRKNPMPVEEVAKLVAASPELARVGSEVQYFDPGDGSYLVRSSADRAGVSFTTQPVLWSPEPGQQVLVVSARGKSASFVAAWWLLPDGGYRLASSFLMLGEIAPVALAYRPGERTLFWTSCWMCPGETGHVSVREDHHIVIVQE
jgi:hypothetical protein